MMQRARYHAHKTPDMAEAEKVYAKFIKDSKKTKSDFGKKVKNQLETSKGGLMKSG